MQMIIQDFFNTGKIEKSLIKNGLNIESANYKSLLFKKSAKKLISIGNKKVDPDFNGFFL